MQPLPLVLFAIALAGFGCSDSNGLPDATLENIERTDTLWALIGTPITTPSGYAVDGSRRVRTDLLTDFDFAYNLEPGGRHVFLPQAALGIDTANTVKPGFRLRSESFEAITIAPGDGYITDEPVPIAVGERYVVRSRIACNIGVPKYAKLEILGVNEALRIITFRVLTNENCGFRSLEPGIPDR